MAFRLYIVPVDYDAEGGRRPKYFSGLRWSGMDYGFQPVYLIGADLTPQQDTDMVAHSDVYAFPFDLATTVGGGNVQEARNAFELVLIPAQWINGQMTWREVARMVSGMFQFMQRLNFYLGNVVLIDDTAKLNIQWSAVPANYQTAILDAAVSLGYDVSFIQANTQMRIVLEDFASAWGAKAFHLNEFTF